MTQTRQEYTDNGNQSVIGAITMKPIEINISRHIVTQKESNEAWLKDLKIDMSKQINEA